MRCRCLLSIVVAGCTLCRMKTRMVAVLGLGFVLGCATRLVAQQPAPAPDATFTSRAELVLVPVHVQRHGEHEAALKQDTFTLLQDGKPQKISVFEEIRTTTKRLQRVQVPPGEFTNELEGDANAARYTVIAIDRLNTATLDMRRLRDGLLTFLKKATDSGEPIRLVAINLTNIQIIQDFTTDPKVLAAALQRMETPAGKTQPEPGEASVDDTIAEFSAVANSLGRSTAGMLKALDTMQKSSDEVDDFVDHSGRISSLEALQQIAISLAGFPGRKSVVWASSGYPFTGVSMEIARLCATCRPQPESWHGGYNFAHAGEAMRLDEYTTHLLSTANIAVYPVDVRGVVNTAYGAVDPSRAAAGNREVLQARDDEIKTTILHLADATGGKPCYGREDVSGCFKEALDDERDYYVVGYYIDREKTQPGWHKINVKVAESGVSVRSRTGFLLASFSPNQTKTLDVKLELNSWLLGVGLPFRGRWLPAVPKGDKQSIGLDLRIASSANLVAPDQPDLNLEVAALARRPDGSVAAQFGAHVEPRSSARASPTTTPSSCLRANTWCGS